MSKTVLAQVDGFTPLMDGVVADVGLITAAVFGKAWRFCQMSDGVCKAAQERIAEELGLTRATVNTHMKKLCEAGYLKDNTPDLVGLPHEYADTGKANLSISFTGRITTCQKDLHPPVKNIDTKKELKKQIINYDDNKAKSSKFTPSEIEQNLKLLCKLYQENIGPITGILSEEFQEAAQTYPREFYKDVFTAAVVANARNWKYVLACLKNKMNGTEPKPKEKPAQYKQPQKQNLPDAQAQLREWVVMQGAD